MKTRTLNREIARLCRFYGWTWQYCLSMPVCHFQAALSEVDALRAQEKLDALDVQHTSDPRWLARRLEAIVRAGRTEPVDDETANENWRRMRALFGGEECSRAM